MSEQKQLYHCYGCKKGGGLVTFVMEVHGISFPEAVEEIADRARIALPKALADPREVRRLFAKAKVSRTFW